MLRLERIGHVVTFDGVFPVVEDCTGIRPAFSICDAQGGPTFENMGPCCPGLNDLFKQALSFPPFDVILLPARSPRQDLASAAASGGFHCAGRDKPVLR